MSDELLLDLVGSTEAQRYFKCLLTKFRLKLQEIDPSKEPTIHAVISYWRKKELQNKGIFPFVAIKVQDNIKTSSCIRDLI